MKKIVLISLSIILSLILVESLLRFVAIEPWRYIESENPIIFESDSSLGWKAKEGSYLISATNNTNKKTLMTFGKRSNRLNEYKIEKSDNPAILFIGGSFTQGWGVNDE